MVSHSNFGTGRIPFPTREAATEATVTAFQSPADAENIMTNTTMIGENCGALMLAESAKEIAERKRDDSQQP